MTTKITLQKATRIEGHADIQVEFEHGRLKSARFQVQEFRGFDTFVTGRHAAWVPQLVSRICGLCSISHQVASLRTIEDALEVDVDENVERLRDVLVLSEWIASHSLSYFFLSMPDFASAKGGIFELQRSHPELFGEAISLRRTATRIASLIGQRETHPVSLAVGGMLLGPDQATLRQIRDLAATLADRLHGLISTLAEQWRPEAAIGFPEDAPVNYVAFDGGGRSGRFQVFDSEGRLVNHFDIHEFEENIAEMRVDWSLSKIPYLRQRGFPEGMLLVGPLARRFLKSGFFSDPDVRQFGLARLLADQTRITLELTDVCRLLEMFWAAKKMTRLLDAVCPQPPSAHVDWSAAGQGIGALEAPRGLLIHKYLLNDGCVERIRLLVATQFNNAFINLLITDLAQQHSENGGLSETGSRLIGRCVRLFDPCLSCATH